MRTCCHLILAIALFCIQPASPNCFQDEHTLLGQVTLAAPNVEDTKEAPPRPAPFVEIEVHEYAGALLHTGHRLELPLPLLGSWRFQGVPDPESTSFPPLARPPRA